jgi:lysophospholipase L1-like esterase
LLGGQFLESDGSISVEVMADALHPTERGYQIWADAVMPTFRELLGRN